MTDLSRYSLSPVAEIWDPRDQFALWRQVAIAMVRARFGFNPARTLMEVEGPSYDEVKEREAEVGHDVVAFLDAWRDKLPVDIGKLIHLGLTSSDLVDTANSIHMVESTEIIAIRTDELVRTVANLALTHWGQLRLARTHGQAAESTTFGFQLTRHLCPLITSHNRLCETIRDIAVVKMSGPTGTWRHSRLTDAVKVARDLGPQYRVVESTGQRIPRDGYARWVSELAILAANIEDLALQVRLGSQFGIEEITEGTNRVGSSSMPHKRNPVTSEQLTGLARIVRAQIVPIMDGIATWSERDITHSSVERYALSTAANLTHYVVRKATDLIANLQVDGDRMADNLTSAGDQINSNHYQVELAKKTNMTIPEIRTAIRNLLATVDAKSIRGHIEATLLPEGTKLDPPPAPQIDFVRSLIVGILDV